MKLIPLSRGLSAAVDDQDYVRLLRFKWSAKPCKRGLYAVANIKGPDNRWHQQTMHRVLMNPPADYEVAFKDFNGLNCQRDNLLVVTKGEARRHHHVRQDCKSGHKGLIYNEQAAAVRAGAARALGASCWDPEGVVPALADLLAEKNPRVACAVAGALQQYGRQAEAAVPRLLDVLTTALVDCDHPWLETLARTLGVITPDAKRRLREHYHRRRVGRRATPTAPP